MMVIQFEAFVFLPEFLKSSHPNHRIKYNYLQKATKLQKILTNENYIPC